MIKISRYFQILNIYDLKITQTVYWVCTNMDTDMDTDYRRYIAISSHNLYQGNMSTFPNLLCKPKLKKQRIVKAILLTSNENKNWWWYRGVFDCILVGISLVRRELVCMYSWYFVLVQFTHSLNIAMRGNGVMLLLSLDKILYHYLVESLYLFLLC